ncbi:MAG TPA: hypothetical protein VKA30_10620 [Actinomycetota bacterium]|nr:hypothetical protein [Actinomycetota bacterium]
MAQVENVLLANHAESLNGLLYVNGGGWTHHWRGQPGPGGYAPSQLAVVATFLAGQDEDGRNIPFVVQILAEGDQETLRADGAFVVNPTPGPGPRRSSFAANVNMVFPHGGRYRLVVDIPGQSRREVEFWVHDQAPAPPEPPQEEGPTHTPGYM